MGDISREITIDDLLRKWSERTDKKKLHKDEKPNVEDDFTFCSLCGCFHYKHAHIYSQIKNRVERA